METPVQNTQTADEHLTARVRNARAHVPFQLKCAAAYLRVPGHLILLLFHTSAIMKGFMDDGGGGCGGVIRKSIWNFAVIQV